MQRQKNICLQPCRYLLLRAFSRDLHPFKTAFLKEIIALKELLKSGAPQKIIITTHHKPDADAIGSSLGLYNFLKAWGLADVQVISPTDYGNFLHWMPGNEQVMIYEEAVERSKALIAEADYIFCLDFNALKRINEMGEEVRKSKAAKVMIDHHQEPENFDDYRLWTTKASSTCELIYVFIQQMGAVELLDKNMASCLYAGIMTDTASFRHDTTSPNTLRIAADLIEHGANGTLIHELIYDSYSHGRMRFIGYCLYEKMQVLPELNTVMIVVNREEIKRFGIITGDTEGLVNYGLSIAGIRLAVLIIDRSVKVKMSFRSKGDFPTNRFASEYFNGGGHFHASGGESTESLDQVVERFRQVLPSYKQYLQ